MQIKIIEKANILGMELSVYGDKENPLFLAKDIATWIEHSDVSTMCRNLEETTEKVANIVCTPGGTQQTLFLTEDGVYEVLMTSRKPIAKEFRKGFKEFLKAWRKGEVKVVEEKKPVSALEMFAQSVQAMIELENKMKTVEGDVKRLENNIRRTTTSQHFTIIAYANLHGISHKSYHAPSLGKKATKLCKDEGALTGTIVDSRFGLIKTYPQHILDRVFF